ncbi:MAG: 1-deoxy-D-xylulose-5-phosphate synthase [Deltaproteobacteria bacterium]|nr:1-deoxy-D-xylulose-5-phosphate synthase [Deltaproteobacteria bacterium]
MNKVLDRINSPKDLKSLSLPELKQLANEIRKEIIQTVAKTGGHLAPNLGTVELTIALHYVFDTPRDKIIWDVGHQCYCHKILTGRRNSFHTLRQFRGISGFPNPKESPYDVFGTGHASTSISAALGISTAEYLKNDNGKVIAVIGDGAMTGGMAFEALNQAGELERDLIVVLNDNKMSISPNVGALSSFLSRKLTGRTFRRFKKEIERFLSSLPGGENIIHIVKKSEDSIKTLFTPGMLFLALRFDYLGPVDGHRLEALIKTFKHAREMSGPILIHVLTVKGKGYKPAEQDPTSFHGIGKFKIVPEAPYKVNHKIDDKRPTYTEIFAKTLVDLAKSDKRIVGITAAMPEGTGLFLFKKDFPDRFFDVGIAEQHAVTFAAGLATQGLKPVVAIYSTFLQRAYDQIIHDVCLQDLPVVFAIDRGGIVGGDGPTHHGLFDLSYLRIIPNMIVMSPKDENELRHMLKTAIEYQGPIALRYPRGKGFGVNLDETLKKIPIGEAELITPGEDLAILAIGHMVYPALDAVRMLQREGIYPTLVNARFVKPIDKSLLLKLSRNCKCIVTIEENVITGGFGTAVMEALQELNIQIPVKRLGLPDIFVEHGPQSTLREMYGLHVEGIYTFIKETCLS